MGGATGLEDVASTRAEGESTGTTGATGTAEVSPDVAGTGATGAGIEDASTGATGVEGVASTGAGGESTGVTTGATGAINPNPSLQIKSCNGLPGGHESKVWCDECLATMSETRRSPSKFCKQKLGLADLCDVIKKKKKRKKCIRRYAGKIDKCRASIKKHNRQLAKKKRDCQAQWPLLVNGPI